MVELFVAPSKLIAACAGPEVEFVSEYKASTFTLSIIRLRLLLA